MSERARAATWVVVAYLIAGVAAVATAVLLDGEAIGKAFAADVAATCVVFAFSVAFDNSSFYDPYWSVVPPLIGAYWWWEAGAPAHPRALLALALVTLWAVRLTYNWASGWRGLGHEDWRYVAIRARTGRAYWPVSFAGIHFFPTLQVFLGCLALHPAVSGGGRPLGWLDGVAVAITLGAVAIEAVADLQLRRFSAARSPDGIMDRGLWAYSRHPNYFGEVAFWWGLCVFALAAGAPRWWHAVGALAITVMFVGVSIPLMERRSIARRPAYAAHQRKVSMLVPWFRRGAG